MKRVSLMVLFLFVARFGLCETIVIEHATLYPATTGIIQDGSVVIVDGKITEIGAGVTTPSGAKVIDGRGKHVLPGFIDTHSHMGVYAWPGVDANSDGNELTDPISAQVDALDSVYPQDPAFKRAAAGGVTTVQILPGSGNLIGGKAVTLHVIPNAVTVDEMVFREAPRGIKMALGENPKRVYGDRNQLPSTRMGNIYVLRDAFIKTQEYREKWNRFNSKKDDSAPERNLKWETLSQVLDGTLLVHVHCYRADEMMHMIELADEFKFKIKSFQHSLEAYKVADILAQKHIAAATWADWWGFKMEAWTAVPWNAAYLVSKGVVVNMHSDSSDIVQRLNVEAEKTLKYGMTEADALKTITIFPAQMLGIDSFTGSLEKGKSADIVIMDGPPFSIYSHVLQTMVQGKTTYDRTSVQEVNR
ncbi:MAG TPA: amidohydrolase family protein [Acidobacteriota bacterium]